MNSRAIAGAFTFTTTIIVEDDVDTDGSGDETGDTGTNDDDTADASGSCGDGTVQEGEQCDLERGVSSSGSRTTAPGRWVRGPRVLAQPTARLHSLGLP